MRTATAVTALSALAQERRLAIFRRLVPEGAIGLSAGTLAGDLGIAPPNLTFHLRQFEAAGLIRARRKGRQMFYAIEVAAMRRLLAFLVDDCCQGQPELCLPATQTSCYAPPRSRRRAQAGTRN
jgi:DNA-binding transcriptional ArsR family regulator